MTFRKQIGDKVVISNIFHEHYREVGLIVDIRGKWAMVLLDNQGKIIVILLSDISKRFT
ncbi:MAG TPA: hypothetical protein P5293_01050 [Bacteroidales bacterium]|nr:hypothetical protein [Bacteroidales bacterium]